MALLKNKDEIAAWLEKYHIKAYELVADNKYGWTVNISNTVELYDCRLSEIPVKFGICEGTFNASGNVLTSLDFAPQRLLGNFDVGFNRLTTLRGCPQELKNFWCNSNLLKSLYGGPEKVEGLYNASNNDLRTVLYLPKLVGDFYIDKNPICKHFANQEQLYELHLLETMQSEKKKLQQILHSPQNHSRTCALHKI